MKLAIITDFILSDDAPCTYENQLVHYFRKDARITDLLVLTNKTQKACVLKSEGDKCRTQIIPCWKPKQFKNAIAVSRVLKKQAPDAVLFHLDMKHFAQKAIPAFYSLCTSASHFTGVPVIVSLNEDQMTNEAKTTGILKGFFGLKKQLNLNLTKLLLNRFMVTVSEEVSVNQLGLVRPDKKVIFIPKGNTVPVTPGVFKQNLSEIKVIAEVSSETDGSIDRIIEAVTDLRKEMHFPIRLDILAKQDREVNGPLLASRQRNKLSSFVRIHRYINGEERLLFYRKSDIVVLPKLQGRIVEEQLHQVSSRGKITLMAKHSGLQKHISRLGYKPLYYDLDDPKSLKLNLKVLSIDNQYRINLTQQNLKTAKALSLKNVCSKYLDMLTNSAVNPAEKDKFSMV
ncbi:glycosyltransferase [Gilvibacter sp.]|uniref:glycosyltransferase n=1 Tax=Gilvibacter sp. TaxID=2729997 RepID=UPI0025BB8E1A|nr:glycosyltransferase [Gilvibacter sp.]NQX78004.1 glycosyltransferase [Gilvibacter sp.]